MCSSSERINRSVDNVCTKYESVHYTATSILYIVIVILYTLERRFDI